MHYQNYIGGQWLPAQSGETFPNHNPATGELLGYFPRSGAADANAAVAAARAAFEQWRLVPAPKRGELLYRVGELLRQRKEELARDDAGDGENPQGDARHRQRAS